jgi:rubrerythrin
VALMTDTTSQPPVGASWWERELFTHLTDHVRNERDVLEAYVAAADATDSRALAYLVRILIEDERRHHRLFQELADSLKHDAELRDGDPAIPRLDFQLDPAVRDLTDQLIDREQEDLRELKKLQKDVREIKDTTLWSLLVDLMQHDTKKHIAMLRFVQKRT